MQVVDSARSEVGRQRRKTEIGLLLHCCCICGRLETWVGSWSYYGSYKEEEDGVPLPKFCSESCRKLGGIDACDVTDEMKAAAKAMEWREPAVAYREATDNEKFRIALGDQGSRPSPTSER